MILVVSVDAASRDGTGHLSKTSTRAYLYQLSTHRGYFSLWCVTSSRARAVPKAPAPTIITEGPSKAFPETSGPFKHLALNCSRRIFTSVLAPSPVESMSSVDRSCKIQTTVCLSLSRPVSQKTTEPTEVWVICFDKLPRLVRLS